jgi:adenylylsulfate kinase
MVVWVLGLSGAGKTTLCQAVLDLMKPLVPGLVALDGDAVRQAFGHDLGHSEADRIRQFQRLQGMAKVLAEQDVAVIVAAVYSNPDLLSWNRENLPNYFEVFVSASLETVKRRDSKGLYSDADAGKIPDVVGIDIPFQAPSSPDFLVDTEGTETPETHAANLARAVPLFSSALEGAANRPTEDPATSGT